MPGKLAQVLPKDVGGLAPPDAAVGAVDEPLEPARRVAGVRGGVLKMDRQLVERKGVPGSGVPPDEVPGAGLAHCGADPLAAVEILASITL